MKELRDEVVQLTGSNSIRSIDIEDFHLGLNNSMLSTYKPFSRDTVRAMEAFLSGFEKPYCFVGKYSLNYTSLAILYTMNTLH